MTASDPPPQSPIDLPAMIRRLCFAIGCGLIAGGIGEIFRSNDAAALLGVGAGMIGMVIRMPRRFLTGPYEFKDET